MSSSETDDSTYELDDFEDDMYNDGDYDDIQDLDDTSHLTSLFNSLLSAGIPDTIAVGSRIDRYPIHTIRSAFGISSSASSNGTRSSSTFGDSIRSYVEASTLFGPTVNPSPYYLSVNPTINQLNSNPAASDKLFVANIDYTATSHELKEFFIQLHFNVIHIHLPNNQKRVNLSFSNLVMNFSCIIGW